MNKLIASIFSVLFAIFTIFVVIFLIYSSNFYSGYVFFGGLLLFIIFFGFLAVLLDIRDEIILIREKIVDDSDPKEDNPDLPSDKAYEKITDNHNWKSFWKYWKERIQNRNK